jgi:tRNA(adenine34) deaminase
MKVSRSILHPKTVLVGGIMKDECGELVKQFFRKKRESY